MRLEGKTAIVTGGTSGIGKGIAAAFVTGTALELDGGLTLGYSIKMA